MKPLGWGNDSVTSLDKRQTFGGNGHAGNRGGFK